jgi:hypothetical protein
MSAILYGNLRAEIVGSRGVRLSRVTLQQAKSDLLRPSQPEAPYRPRLLGREREMADWLAAFQAGRPVGFHAACGYGKTTLLQNIVATASERALPPIPSICGRTRTGSRICCSSWWPGSMSAISRSS